MDNTQAEQLQQQLLPGVSRTFALTIPQLPAALCPIVTNAYLLCRITDTVEDDPGLTIEQKQQFHDQFINLLQGEGDSQHFATTLYSALSDKTLEAERQLIKNTPPIIGYMLNMHPAQRQAISQTVTTMTQGMSKFERNASLDGLADVDEFKRYCYYVAGVVGEMLTDLFCHYSTDIAKHQADLKQLAASFGLGLQMTNILKDQWEDRQNGVSWLPRDIFDNQSYEAALKQSLALATHHLKEALDYTLLIPKQETGIRRFCLWAIGLAVLTLRNINHNPSFTSSQQVKVSRRKLKATILTTNICCKHNRLLNFLFNLSAKSLQGYQNA